MCREDAPCLHSHISMRNHQLHLFFAATRSSTGDGIATIHSHVDSYSWPSWIDLFNGSFSFDRQGSSSYLIQGAAAGSSTGGTSAGDSLTEQGSGSSAGTAAFSYGTGQGYSSSGAF